MSLYIASCVAFFRTVIVYSSNNRYQVPGFFPGYVHTLRTRVRDPRSSPPRSSLGSEPESSSLDSEMDDTLYSPNLRSNPSTHPCRSIGEHLLVHTAEVYQVHGCNSNTSTSARILLFLFNHRYVKCWNVCIIPGIRYSLICKPAYRPTIQLF